MELLQAIQRANAMNQREVVIEFYGGPIDGSFIIIDSDVDEVNLEFDTDSSIYTGLDTTSRIHKYIKHDRHHFFYGGCEHA